MKNTKTQIGDTKVYRTSNYTFRTATVSSIEQKNGYTKITLTTGKIIREY